LLLGAAWLLAPVVSAQLGSLVVTITAPASGATVSGTTTVSANVSMIGALTVAGVQFKLDGANLGAEDTTAPYSIPWNTKTTSNGSHTLTAVARAGLSSFWTSDPVTVTVFNDITPPTVTMTSPSSGATVRGSIAIAANATDNVGVAGVQFRLDGANLGAEDTTAPYSILWDTTTASNSSHALTAIARDAAGNLATAASVTITVDNSPPTVSIASPAAGATVSASITISANASDNIAVAGVQFLVDGAPLGTEDTSAPYEISWNTTTAAAGSHTLTATARDGAGNTTTSAGVPVTVSNTDTTPPAVTVTSPSGGATVFGTITVAANASDNVAVAGVQFFIDGAPLGAEDTSAPYSATWDTTTAANASHAVTARARDAAGNTAVSAAVTVTVANGAGSTVRIEDGNTAIAYRGAWNVGNTARPWSGGTAAIGYSTGQDAVVTFRGTGITWIGFQGPWAGIARVYVDGALAATIDGYAPAEAVQAPVFTVGGLPLATHTLTIDVTRTKNASSTDFVVIVDAFDIIGAPPDTTAPVVSITAPSGGTTVFGTVPVSASATDNNGVAAVTFFVDGVQIGSPDTISPYGINWNTTTVADGSHTLTAVARDAAGNTTTSAPVTVMVANAAPPALATATRIENTSLGISYVEGCATCGQAASWFHGSRSRAWSDGTASFSRADGGRATYVFTGTAVKWIGFRAGWAGIARVFVDGAFVAELDLFSPTEEVQVPVFQAADLAPGTHTIAVESTGRKNPAATDYAVVVDAFDISPGLPPPVEGTRYEENAATATFTPGWNRTDTTHAWSGGTAAVASGVGERATFVFAGTSVKWVGKRGPDMGIARVYLDGAFQAQVDSYFPSIIQGLVYSVTGLAPGGHRLEIEVTGLKHDQSTGSAVAVDAYDVRSRIEENDAPVVYSGTWTFNDTGRNWSDTSLTTGAGTASSSATAGARADLPFAGTGVTWIGLRGPWLGIAAVYLDGVFAQQVDLYSATEQVQAPLFTASGLAPGSHTLRVEATGTKNPAASTALVIIDAFDVTLPTPAPPVSRVQENDPAVAYSAGWVASGTTSLWSGANARETGTVGAQARFSFSGNSVRWIGERGFGTGLARVSIDGRFIAQIDTRTPFQEEYQEPVFTATGLAPGTHTLTIEVVGRNNEAPGTIVERIVIDAFDFYQQ
jgi:hypothetical protein